MIRLIPSCVILLSCCLISLSHAQCHCSTGVQGVGIGFVAYNPNSQTPLCSSCYEDYISIDIQIDGESFELLIVPNYFISSIDINEPTDNDRRRQSTDVQPDDTANSTSVYREESYVGTCRFCNLYKNSYATQEKVTIYSNGSFVDFCRNNSQGFFCSQCKEGYYHNLGTVCERCDNLGGQWVLYLLSQFVPMTLWFAFLLYFDISVIAGPLNAVLFTAQLLSSTMDIDQEEIPVANITGSSESAYALTAIYKLIYGPTNLEFFSPFVNDLCLFRADSYLYNFIPQYLVAFYPLFLIVIGGLVFSALKQYYHPSRSRNLTSVKKFVCGVIPSNRLQRPPVKVFTSIAVLAYIKFTWLCTLLLSPSILYDYKGETSKIVFTFDPSISLFEGDSSPIIIVGIICFIFISLLPALFLFSRREKVPQYLKILKKVILVPFKTPESSDAGSTASAEDGERRNLCSRLRKWIASVQPSDTNTVRKQIIPAIYLVMRISLLMAYLLSKDIMYRLVVHQVILVFGALMFLIVKPYPSCQERLADTNKRQRPRYDNNKLDSCILLILAFINTLSMYQFYRAVSGRSLNPFAFAIQYALIFVPLVWFIYYTIHHVYINFRRVNGRLYFTGKASDVTASLVHFLHRSRGTQETTV